MKVLIWILTAYTWPTVAGVPDLAFSPLAHKLKFLHVISQLLLALVIVLVMLVPFHMLAFA